MKGRKSVNSISTQNPCEQSEQNKQEAGKTVSESSTPSVRVSPNYESASFAKPALDQFKGVFPDLNRRLSSDRDLGLSSKSLPRLSSEPRPRLFSAQVGGLSTGIPKAVSEIRPEVPVRKSFEVEPDQPTRAVTEKMDMAFSVEADLAVRPVESRFFSAQENREEKE